MRAVARSPTLEAYIASLPRGLDSYPEAQEKAGALRVSLGGTDLDAVCAVLPPAILDLIRNPPPVATWMSETLFTGLLCAQLDVLHGGRVESFREDLRDRNRRLLAGPLYKALFLVMSPSQVLRRLPDRWAAIHRGTSLDLVENDTPGRATIVQHFPPRLLPEWLAFARGASFEVGLELVGAKNIKVELTTYTDTSATFVGRWT